MWRLDNNTPFAADASWIRGVDGNEIWVVTVKATYDIMPDGRTHVSSTQVPVSHGPTQDENGVPLGETDLGPPKENTDILMLGHAHAPQGKPVTELPIGFRVGNLVRAAHVFGNRQWERGVIWLHPGKPEPFVSMPLHWGRCFGGFDPVHSKHLSNPVGCGLVTSGTNRPLPNVEHPDRQLRTPQDRPDTVGFGAVLRHWNWRAQHSGTYDKTWEATRRPLLPLDLNPLHWQIAPPEQQYAGHLRGGETVVLVHLTAPQHSRQPGRLQLNLPKLSLGFVTFFYDGSRMRSRSRIHTVILEPDYPRVTVVHHMSLPCHPLVNKLDRTVITVKKRPLDPPEQGRS